MVVMLKKIGGSLAVVIPGALVRENGLSEGTRLDITSSPDGITLRPKGRRPRRPMAEIVRQIKPAAYARRNAEFSADRPVGRESW